MKIRVPLHSLAPGAVFEVPISGRVGYTVEPVGVDGNVACDLDAEEPILLRGGLLVYATGEAVEVRGNQHRVVRRGRVA